MKPVQEPTDSARGQGGKGRPTPTRKEREAARRRPLVPEDRQAAKKANKEAAAEARRRQNIALQTGDERYLPAKDKGAQRRFVRDWIDARRNLGDVFLIVLLVLYVASLFLSSSIQMFFMYSMGILILLWLLDWFLLWRGLKKAALAKFRTLEPGLAMYGFNRVMMLRRWRMPKPQVKYGQYPS